MSNFPGCFGVMKVNKYQEIFSKKNVVLEDYLLTLKTLEKKSKIALNPRILAYDREKNSLRKLFLQRVRWTLGNIELLPIFFQTFRKIRFPNKLLLLSYPLLWYLLYYHVSFLMIFGLLTLNKFILFNYLLLMVPLYLLLLNTKLQYRDLNPVDFITLIIFIIFFPLVISLSLIVAVPLFLGGKIKEVMKTEKYFER